MEKLSEFIKQPQFGWLEKYKDRLVMLTINEHEESKHVYGIFLPTVEQLLGLNKMDTDILTNNSHDISVYELNDYIENYVDNRYIRDGIFDYTDALIFNDIGTKMLEQYENITNNFADRDAFLIESNKKLIKDQILKYSEPLEEIRI